MTYEEKVSILAILIIIGLFLLGCLCLYMDSQYTYENTTTKLLGKENYTYTQFFPISNGKTTMLIPQITYDYWFKTEYGDIWVPREVYEEYDVNDNVPIRLNKNTSDVDIIWDGALL